MIGTRIYWLIQRTRDVPADDYWLTDRERSRLDVMFVPKRREEWRLGRWTAKRAVTAYLAGGGAVPSVSTLEIGSALSGAPEVLLNGKPFELAISLSHREGLCLCGLGAADVGVGCDLEVIEPRSNEFVADYFTPEEHDLLAGVADEDYSLFVNLIWSAKESALKVLRQGLRMDTHSVFVRFDPDATGIGWKPIYIRCVEPPRRFHGWWMVMGGFVMTLSAPVLTDKPVDLQLYLDAAASFA